MSSSSQKAKAPARKSVLVIDDDEIIRASICEYLGRTGHEAFEAVNGEQGLAQCRARRVDVVITDVIMPEKDGVELILALRREFPRVKIIAMSGVDKLYLENARKLGADEVLQKPFRLSELDPLIS